MKHFNRFLSLALVLLLSLSSAALAAEGDTGYAASSVDDIYVTPSATDGHLRFGEPGDLKYLSTKLRAETAATMSLADAMAAACQAEMGADLDCVGYLTVSPTQGTLYDGYISEGDTGAGVAGTQRYYYGSFNPSNYHLETVRFVPKASFSGQAIVSYYGYTQETPSRTFAGRIYITVGKQEPGIAYSTDGEAVRFSSEDFSSYSLAVTGRTFRFISFTLPNAACGALYYNYISESVYDSAVTTGARYYRGTSPTLDNVSFVPKPGYTGEFLLGFSGMDISGAPFTGQITIRVTSHGPNHPASASGPFVYTVQSGRPVSLRAADFAAECLNQKAANFQYFRLVSLPDAKSGTLYDDGVPYGSLHYAVVDRAYTVPENLRFAAASGWTGVVSVPIIVTCDNGEWFDSALRFVVNEGIESRLHYTADPEKRVSFLASDFSDACYDATGYSIRRLRFNSLPLTTQGGLYFNGSTPVRTGMDYYYYELDNLSFLASSTFTGSLTIPFTGYADGYSSYGRYANRSFTGNLVIESSASAASAAENAKPIGGVPGSMSYATTGPAVTLNGEAIAAAAAPSLPRPVSTITLAMPEPTEGRLYSDFISLTQKDAFDSSKPHTPAEISRTSFVPKAGFSGTLRLGFTAKDGGGNSYTGSIQITVTPPTQSAYFNDMGNASWAVPAVDFFYHYGATNGNSVNGFGPNAGMRRGDFILLLSRAFNLPASGIAAGFDDVPAISYFGPAISAARAAGILSDDDGYLIFTPVQDETDESADGEAPAPLTETQQLVERYEKTLEFKPYETINREDAAVFLYRALRRAGNVELGNSFDLAPFEDSADVSPYAAEAMATLVRMGILNGAYGRLNPQFPLTRAATMKLLYYALT